MHPTRFFLVESVGCHGACVRLNVLARPWRPTDVQARFSFVSFGDIPPGPSSIVPAVVGPDRRHSGPRRLLSQPYVYSNVGIGGTGTPYNANVNPNNPSDIYMESDMGEVWHTTNDGLTGQR